MAVQKGIHILVTGGAGFIGTHTVVQILNEGFKVTIIDNLDNSVEEAILRVRDLVGPQLSKNLEFCLVGFFILFFDFVYICHFFCQFLGISSGFWKLIDI